MKTAVQQIMLGTVTGSESRARETLHRIKAAGYDGLELNRFMIHPSSLMVRLMTRAAGMPTGKGGNLDWHGLLQESGLEVVSLHADLGSLEREGEAVAEEARSFGTDKVVITGMYRFDYSDEKTVRELAQRLNAAGEKLKRQGIELLYHNHNVELLQVKPGLRAYDILIRDTDRSYVNFEFDSYWFTDGGADAKAWMRKLGSRMKLWHVTDRGSRQSGPAMTPILKADSMELGTGSMDLEGLKDIALANGVDALVLESHKNWIDRDPLKSMELSAKWLKEKV
jgi:sugar phosphate isomerase/epimerase